MLRSLKNNAFYDKIYDFTHRKNAYLIYKPYGLCLSNATLPNTFTSLWNHNDWNVTTGDYGTTGSAKKDIEHNLRALLDEAVSKMDLVSKDEIQRQRIALDNANLKLAHLLQQVEHLELKIKHK